MIVLDQLTGIPTILAPNRRKRDFQIHKVEKNVGDVLEYDASCHFCKGNETMTPSTLYQDQADWNVRVFENKFKLLDIHEVVVHSPHHLNDIEDFPIEQTHRILRAYQNRASFHNSNGNDVFIFNNRGAHAGASIKHPHSQLVALECFPGILEKEKISAEEYFKKNKSCYWCDLLKSELMINARTRVVYETSHFVAIVPVASRWSYELMIVPKSHKPSFSFATDEELSDLALMLKLTLTSYNTLFDKPDRNFWIHTLREKLYHWHIGLIPQIKELGGVELGAGIWASDKATPEEAAAALRGEIEKAHPAISSLP